ncbi:MAG: ribosome recycling factor [Gammaproteobacteria bacterium]|nr:ribosome recycling factor [Gammaproteobacteria bacterium]|tara:strand:- start:51600 stop:52157 length:558 start_codon:yes stop_codon:yes gene_type:complete
MFEDLKKETEVSMNKALDVLHLSLNKIRAGRPNPSMLDQIEANYFDTLTPIKQLSNISVTDATTISLNVWDKNAVSSIEKAINESDLGITPTVNGLNIHIKIPPLTQERRDELIKIVKKEAENTKVTLRNIRRNTNTSINNLEKDKKISKDFERDYIIEIQELTDSYILKCDEIIAKKNTEISEV